jgi:hypothetical protein
MDLRTLPCLRLQRRDVAVRTLRQATS